MNKNEASEIHKKSIDSRLSTSLGSNFNSQVASLLVNKNKIQELYEKGSDRDAILQTLGGYFEHPQKGGLHKQLKQLRKSQDSNLDDKQLFVSIYHDTLSLRELLDSQLLESKTMSEYEELRKVVIPILEGRIFHELKKADSQGKYSEIIYKMSTGFGSPDGMQRHAKSVKDLLSETEKFCILLGIDTTVLLDKVTLPFDKVLNELMKNKKLKTKGALIQMEPLLGAQLETKVVDKILLHGKQLNAYEKGVYTGDTTELLKLVDAGFLNDQLAGTDKKQFIKFLKLLYSSSKKSVALPGVGGQEFKLGISRRYLGTKHRNTLQNQHFGDWDETLPLASIDIDLDNTSDEIIGILAHYFPEKFEKGGNIIFLKGKKYKFVDQFSGKEVVGYPSIRPVANKSSKGKTHGNDDWAIEIHSNPNGFLEGKKPKLTIDSKDALKYHSEIQEKLGDLSFDDKELILLQDVYLACAHAKADELYSQSNIEHRDYTSEAEALFQDIQDRQQGSGEKVDTEFVYEGDDEETPDGHAVTDEEGDSEEDKLRKGASYYFGGYTDKVPPQLEQELRLEMGNNYPKHGPYAWIEKGKVYYNTKWIKEKFAIEITQNPDASMVAISPLYAYLYNGKTMDDPELDTGTENFRAFSVWKEEQKRHEVLHRILGFNKIAEIKVATMDGRASTLTQEQLCALAEAAPGTRTPQITINGKKYLLVDIEDAIAKALGRESFSFDNVQQIDLDLLEAYIAHGDEAFLDQLDANAGAGRTINKNELADEPALVTVLADHEATAPRSTGKGGIERSTPIKIGSKKYVHERKGGATPISRWMEIIQNDEDRKNPYQREVTSADMAAELAKLNNGDYDGVPEQATDGRSNNRQSGGSQNNNAEQTESSNEEDNRDFKTEFANSIDGDSNAKFDVGTILYFKLTDSQLPGYGGIWLKANISEIDETAKKFTIKLDGSTEGTIGNMMGHTITKTIDKKGYNWITQRGEVRKFKKVNSGSDFYNYITQDLDTHEGTIKAGKQARAGQQIKRENGKLLQKKYYKNSVSKYDTITHIGKIDKANKKNTVLYKVAWNADSVTVTHDNPSWTREMDYNTFLLFTMDKGLAPFSDEQIAAANEDKKTHQDSQRPKVSWTTLAALGQAFKNMGPLFKNAFNMEERKKIQAARLTYNMSKLFGGGVAMEALNNLDESIYSTISKFQSSLGGRESKDAGDVHAEAVSRRIQKEIFTPGFVIDPSMFKLKAAGYLLYALDKGGHPYFRALNVNAHQGLWVKAILGEKHHEVFMVERQKLIDEAKSGPENQILFDKLIKFELNYIHTTVDKEEMVSVFGSQFGKKVEGYKDKFGSGDAIDNIKNAMANKNNFDDFANTFRGTLVKHTPATAIAALELMVENAGSPAQYSEVYQSVIQLFVSGLGTRSFGQDHKDRLKKIGRMAGIPIALMADDVNAPYKVLTIVDHIASRAGITKLSQFEGTDGKKVKKTDELSVNNLTSGNGHKKSMEAIQEWRGTERNGQTIYEAFNYKNSHLLTYEESASGETKAIIDEYFDKRVFDELADTRFGHSDKLTLGGDSPFYSNGIMNISPATFNKVMLSFDNNTGQFREPGAKDMRIQFKDILNQMDAQLTNSKGVGRKFLLKLVLKKFALYMGSQFDSAELADFKKSILEGSDIDEVEDLLKYKFGTGIYVTEEADINLKTGKREVKPKRKRGRRNANSQVTNGLDALIRLFRNHGAEIDDETIRYAFGK